MNAGRGPPFDLGDESDVFFDGEVGEEAYVLNYISNSAAQFDYVPLMNGTAFHQKVATARSEKVVDQFERRGLAASAAPEKHQSLAASHFEIQLMQEFAAVPETIRNVAELNGGTGPRFHVAPVLGGFNHTGGECRQSSQDSEMIRRVRQAGDANPGMPFVTNVQSDQ